VPDFNQIWVFSTDLSQKSPILNFMEIRPVGAVLIHTDRQTDKESDEQDEVNRHYLQLYKFASKLLNA